MMRQAVLLCIVVLCCISATQSWMLSKPTTTHIVRRSTPIPPSYHLSTLARVRTSLCMQDDSTEGDSSSEGNEVQPSEANTFTEEDVTSAEIRRMLRRIDEIRAEIDQAKKEISSEEQSIEVLNKEYGPQIERIKKEFARMKERSYEEAIDMSKQAKVAALKDILPITDNFYRAKSIYDPLQNENEEKIYGVYNDIFESVLKVIEEFGIQKIESLGKRFDYNTMEAIVTQPSLEYAKDIVCKEYQIGYVMGDKCVRPAMVVVSLGPGPPVKAE